MSLAVIEEINKSIIRLDINNPNYLENIHTLEVAKLKNLHDFYSGYYFYYNSTRWGQMIYLQMMSRLNIYNINELKKFDGIHNYILFDAKQLVDYYGIIYDTDNYEIKNDYVLQVSQKDINKLPDDDVKSILNPGDEIIVIVESLPISFEIATKLILNEEVVEFKELNDNMIDKIIHFRKYYLVKYVEDISIDSPLYYKLEYTEFYPYLFSESNINDIKNTLTDIINSKFLQEK